MQILVDENIPLADEFFASLGKVTRKPGRNLTAADVKNMDALIVRSVTQVNEALLAGSKVKFVGTCTIGTDHLDKLYLEQQGIGFSSAPGCNANSVVEFVISSLAALDVDWRGKTLGIIGCGNVGGHLYRRLQTLGAECFGYDPLIEQHRYDNLTTLDRVLDCDIICTHTPFTVDGPHPSQHLLSYERLSQIKPGAVLLNAGRGPTINNNDLKRLLTERDDLKVVLDVWEPEPAMDCDLLTQVDLGSPHIAGYSLEGKMTGTSMIYQALCQHFGLAEKVFIDDLLPQYQGDHTHLPEDSWQGLRQLILGAYDVRGDDKRLRVAALQPEFIAERFDQLRKSYPVRREFAAVPFTMADGLELDHELLIRLATLGFTLRA